MLLVVGQNPTQCLAAASHIEVIQETSFYPWVCQGGCIHPHKGSHNMGVMPTTFHSAAQSSNLSRGVPSSSKDHPSWDTPGLSLYPFRFQELYSRDLFSPSFGVPSSLSSLRSIGKGLIPLALLNFLYGQLWANHLVGPRILQIRSTTKPWEAHLAPSSSFHSSSLSSSSSVTSVCSFPAIRGLSPVMLSFRLTSSSPNPLVPSPCLPQLPLDLTGRFSLRGGRRWYHHCLISLFLGSPGEWHAHCTRWFWRYLITGTLA